MNTKEKKVAKHKKQQPGKSEAGQAATSGATVARMLVDEAKRASDGGKADALELWRMAARESELAVGEDYRLVVFAHSQYAHALIQAGELKLAETILLNWLPIAVSRVGSNIPVTIGMLQRAGLVKNKLRKGDEAAQYYLQAAAAAEVVYGQNSPTEQFSLCMGGRALIGKRQFERALPLLRKAYDISFVNDGCSIGTAYALKDLVVCLMRLHQFQEAFDLADDALNIVRESGVGRRKHRRLKKQLWHYKRRCGLQLKAKA